jgi:hypothetical protein
MYGWRLEKFGKNREALSVTRSFCTARALDSLILNFFTFLSPAERQFLATLQLQGGTMNKRLLPAFVLIILTVSLLSYKFGSAPMAHAQTTPPPEWSVWATSHSSANAYATKPGVAGVTHVADCIIADATNAPGAAPAGPIGVKLYDGSVTTSPSTVLLVIDLPQPSYAANGGQVHLCGLNLQGTAGRPMQLQIGGFVGTSPYLSVNLVGHD